MIYPYLDIFKFISALMIVFMHAYCHDLGKFGEWINSVICNIGVPFFFITSGFFYTKRLQRNKNNKIILRTLEVKHLHTNTLQALEAILLFIIAEREPTKCVN